MVQNRLATWSFTTALRLGSGELAHGIDIFGTLMSYKKPAFIEHAKWMACVV
jgi:hypothetical protein